MLPKMAISAPWAEMYSIAKTSRREQPIYTGDEIEKYGTLTDPYRYPSVDWPDVTVKYVTTAHRVDLQ